MKRGLAGTIALCALAFAGAGFGATSYSDAAGDDNAAPDVTNLTASESPDGTLTLAVAVANYQVLPANSWFNIWFDLDSNQNTGDAGDEALIRYLASGAIDFYLWDGSELVQRTAVAMSGRFEAGVLTLTVPKSALGTMSSFGILAVSARGQELGEDEFIASDYAPDLGRSAYVGPGQAAFPDQASDQDAAPDITAVRVSDAKDGWISFAISTPNYVTLPGESVLVISIDRDDRASTGDGGAEISITTGAGEVLVQRWEPSGKRWIPDDPPVRARVRNSGNVVTVELHRSELENTPRFGFAAAAIDVNVEAELVLGVDFAPDDGGFYRYAMVNKAALRLLAGKAFGTPAQPRAGKPFTISLPVRRSDTTRVITSGAVSCNVTAVGKKVPAVGKVRSGKGQCTFVVPKTATVVRGSMTVRSGGTSVTARFSFRVR